MLWVPLLVSLAATFNVVAYRAVIHPAANAA